MDGFGDYFLKEEYSKIAGLGNKLGEIRNIIDWEQFRPIISDMYHDTKESGGRPHTDEILMIKMHILAGWHGLSDYELELLAMDRLSFRHFLGYPEKMVVIYFVVDNKYHGRHNEKYVSSTSVQ